jgi:hypothetical protein
VLDRRLGINIGIYVGHSAVRRFVMGDAASEREANDGEIQQMAKIVRDAMRAGAAGFTSSKSPTHVDHLKRPVPSRKASFQEIKTLAAAAGEGGAGSIGYLAETAVQGYQPEDRQRIVELALASGLPVVVQGMGYRPARRIGGTTRSASSPTRARRARPSTRCSARSRSCGRSTGTAARRCSRAATRGASSAT